MVGRSVCGLCDRQAERGAVQGADMYFAKVRWTLTRPGTYDLSSFHVTVKPLAENVGPAFVAGACAGAARGFGIATMGLSLFESKLGFDGTLTSADIEADDFVHSYLSKFAIVRHD